MPSTVADCTKYYYVVLDDTCESIEAAYDITAAQVRNNKEVDLQKANLMKFSTWNPYVSDGTDCQHLWLDNYVCVDAPDQSSTTTASATTTTQTASSTTPSPLIPSTDANCSKYHYVVDNEDCESIESDYGITAAQVSFQNALTLYQSAGTNSLSSTHGILMSEATVRDFGSIITFVWVFKARDPTAGTLKADNVYHF